ncbi:MAG: hypothetical protein KDA25_03210 [Phycisphaerales bacterium]|nr:hypothetical protein [Phycisphaerales bacterium]
MHHTVGGVARPFHVDCQDAVGRLRAALIGLYAAVGADPARPQDVSRRFRLDKSLTWKISRALHLDDPFAAAAVLPGASGIEILVDVMARHEAPAEIVAAVRRASEEYERVIDIHTGDRETLRLILDSMGRNGKALELSRRQAYRGSSGIWGVQCEVRVAAQCIAPNAANADRLDLAFVGGWTDIRRLRPIPRWPILDVRHWRDDGTEADGAGARPPTPRYAPLADPDGDDGGWILRDFCAGEMPEVFACQHGDGIRFELGDGPIGRTGDFTCFTGYVSRDAASRYASEGDQYGQLRTGVSFPAASLLFDLFVHADLKEALAPEVQHFGRLPRDIVESDPSQVLPMAADVLQLGRNPSVATPLVPRYDAMIDSAMAAAGWSRADFHLLRIVYAYPPVLSTIGLRFPLAQR